ncbi:hypothetical protein, partial [Muribaculum intestinale]|uniref:hypothetical protein n=1 Tax=Muribaculum intestinale TaxID=1796646 RepID=UPI0024314CF4
VVPFSNAIRVPFQMLDTQEGQLTQEPSRKQWGSFRLVYFRAEQKKSTQKVRFRVLFRVLNT